MRNPSDRPTRGDRQTRSGPADRDERLRAALKANLARRKEQAKARGATKAPGLIKGEE
jgi:hypothetical protein